MRWQSDNDDFSPLWGRSSFRPEGGSDQKAYRAAKGRLAVLRQRQVARDYREHMAMLLDREWDDVAITIDLPAGD